MVNLFNSCGVLTRGHDFNDLTKSHHNLMNQTYLYQMDQGYLLLMDPTLKICNFTKIHNFPNVNCFTHDLSSHYFYPIPKEAVQL